MGDGQRAPNGDYGVDALVADFTSIAAELTEKPVLVVASMDGMTSLIGQGRTRIPLAVGSWSISHRGSNERHCGNRGLHAH